MTVAQRSMSGEPVDRAESGVDEVEAATAERLDRRVDVRLHELRLDARVAGEPARRLDRRPREVQPGDARAATRPRQRVEPEVALRMDERDSVHVAHFVKLEGAQRRCAGEEPGHVVEVAGDVDRDTLVPHGAIQRFVLVRHGGQSSASRRGRGGGGARGATAAGGA
jgi:hypothetical protein